MKLKKAHWILLAIALISILILAYMFRPMTLKDIYKEPNFNIGDNVSVYCSWIILETYPAQVNEVYAIILRDAIK